MHTFGRTLQEERQEGDEEHQENGLDAALDPIEHRDEIIAAGLSLNDVALRIDLANGELLVQSSDVHDCKWDVSHSHSETKRNLLVNMKVWME